MGLVVDREVRALGEVLAQEAVRVLVAAPLPGAPGIAEVDLYAGIDGDPTISALVNGGIVVVGVLLISSLRSRSSVGRVLDRELTVYPRGRLDVGFAQRPLMSREGWLAQATCLPPLISRCGERRQERLDDGHDSIGGGQSGSVIESGELVELDPKCLRRAPVPVGLVLAAAVNEAGRRDPAQVDAVRE